MDNGVYNAFVNEQEMEAERLQMAKQPDSVLPNSPDNPLIHMQKEEAKMDSDDDDISGEGLGDLSSDEDKALETIRKFRDEMNHNCDLSRISERQEIDIRASMQQLHED
jgi:hypothetical protein